MPEFGIGMPAPEESTSGTPEYVVGAWVSYADVPPVTGPEYQFDPEDTIGCGVIAGEETIGGETIGCEVIAGEETIGWETIGWELTRGAEVIG